MAMIASRAPERTGTRPATCWREVARQAQAAFAGTLGQALVAGTFDRAYRHWLALDSALSRSGALALERLADWHGAQPTLRATALSWAHDLREDAIAAAADLRAVDTGGSPTLAPAVAHWHGYVTAACGSPRAGEALGTILLHGALLQGAAWPVAAAAVLPGRPGQAWLRRRLRDEAQVCPPDRADLCAAWPAAALATGARRAWDWYRAALETMPGFAA